MCLCVFVCVLVFRPNGKSCCGIYVGGVGLGGGAASDLRLHVFVVFLASCSLCVSVNNRSLNFFVFFLFFYVRLIMYSRLLFFFFKAAELGFYCASFKANLRVLTRSVVSVCSGGRE